MMMDVVPIWPNHAVFHELYTWLACHMIYAVHCKQTQFVADQLAVNNNEYN